MQHGHEGEQREQGQHPAGSLDAENGHQQGSGDHPTQCATQAIGSLRQPAAAQHLAGIRVGLRET